ncbi:hypothetical protein Pst134EA_004651 [Puccinia striiformis f. sp. tritici]|uniref:Uncharacterized protein n=2 Tax=Puccinia striiformis TaxID=27350 RepID=A0A2S4VW31_9BASI|nr:hypothetical protein Pst134EA_004651 [Puccinia striiformis f. sp. tritici]KAH9470727.1 hypothetical protein Pst134EA_004651 [Puccinia striiformis f. sp. tritici]POW13708.1 hypothetical protein PSHT_07616 [Puccinia striiformis]
MLISSLGLLTPSLQAKRDEHENKHRPEQERMASNSKQQTAGNKQANPAASLFAGALAGSIEGFVTYPTEFIKTRSQFRSSTTVGKPPGPIEILKSTVARDGVKGLYSGCSALVIGNGLKAGVRFFSYEKFKKALVDQDGKLSGPRSLLAGLGAGMCEAIIAVTPSETIKTKLVNESMKSNPRFTGLIQGTKEIVKTEGLPGIYRGLFPVMMRQGANSAVRFSTYSSLKALFQGNVRSGQQLPSFMTFVIGGVAGVVTVYCTMPLDVIKTRMQSLEAKTKYVNSFDCGYQIFKFEGVSRFWKGTTPRLIRLSLSGGIVFTVYENLIKLMGGLSV